MKEIILVSPKLGIGGIQRALTNLANWFVENGYEVTFISCKKEEVFYPVDKRVRVIVPNATHPGTSGNIFLHYFYILKFLRKEFKKNQSKNIISFGDAFNPLVLIAALGLNKEIHISDRTSPDYKFKWYIKFLKKITYPLSTTFVAQTSKAAEWNEIKFRNKLNIKIIPNLVRKVEINENVKKEDIILYVGRFAWEKNPKSLIQAFNNIKDKNGWRLVMLGDGPLLNEMKNYSESLGLDTNIEFKGQVKDVDSYYTKASIYVLPSVLEGFPNSLCEAMSFGIACISSSKIPHSDLGLNNHDFLLSDPNDTQDLSNKLLNLMNNKNLRTSLGINAKTITERLSLETIGKKFESILN